MVVSGVRARRPARLLTAMFFASFAVAGAAAAADDLEAEKAKLAQCEKDLCSMIVGKSKTGADLSCDLTKTWAGEDIEKGAKSKSLSWGFGKTQCSVKVSVKRSDVVEALTAADYTLKIEKQAVSCDIERGSDKYPIKMTLAPELKFKGGKTTSASLHVDNIEGAALIKGVVWTAATLEQNFGLFESDLVKEVNKFIERQCPKKLADK